LTPRVLANRVWGWHFGTGIVDTPSDFGYMRGKPHGRHRDLNFLLPCQLRQLWTQASFGLGDLRHRDLSEPKSATAVVIDKVQLYDEDVQVGR
jgi:hypothetical protein